jgi:NAD(P)-dependent dehydrogenase (short-subunit alcohol dehydrogenase family)
MHTLIVGGTRGLGSVAARLFAARDRQVSVIGRRAVAPDAFAAAVQCWTADLTDDAVLSATLQDIVSRRGPISYVAFCQRYRGEGDPWAGELATALGATRAVVEALQENGWAEGDKAMVMVSSVFGEWIGDGQPAGYHVAKAGLLQLMRYYAVNLGPEGIRANAVTPFTFLKPESQQFYLDNAALLELYRETVPLGRLASAEDVARTMAFLCSPEAAFVTGQNLHVDGGLSAVWPESLARRLKGV